MFLKCDSERSPHERGDMRERIIPGEDRIPDIALDRAVFFGFSRLPRAGLAQRRHFESKNHRCLTPRPVSAPTGRSTRVIRECATSVGDQTADVKNPTQPANSGHDAVARQAPKTALNFDVLLRGKARAL